MSEEKVKPDYWLIKMESKGAWAPSVAQHCEHIWEVWLVDRSKNVYCCEMTPSYGCVFVAHEEHIKDGVDEETRDRVNNDIISEDVEQFTYYHATVIERIILEHPERCKQVDPGYYEDVDKDEDITDDHERERKREDVIREAYGTGSLMW